MPNITLLPHRVSPRIINPVALAIARLGITPNGLTAIGFAGNLAAGALAGAGIFWAAGVVMLVASGVDLLDGALARATGRVTAFGGVFDSVLDRLSEAAVLGGLVYHYSRTGSHTEELVLAFAAVTGSILVSYVRARAQGEGLDLREGLFTRAERVLLLSLALIIGWVRPALWLLAIMATGTALQRLYVVWRKLGPGAQRA